jgi:hypothetical protein
VEPADGQIAAVHQLSPERPPLVLPQEHGRAIDDPNTALLERIRAGVLRRSSLVALILILFGVLMYFSVRDGQVTKSVYLGILLVALLALIALQLWLHVPHIRHGKALLSRYGWRRLPATIVSDKPCLVRVNIDGTDVTMRVRRTNRNAKQILLRTPTLWICGPDEQGRALLRLAGSVGHGLTQVTGAVPTGAPPTLIHPATPRPADEPALSWSRRIQSRALLIAMAVSLVFVGIGVGNLTWTGFDFGEIDGTAFGGSIGGLAMFILMAQGYAKARKTFRQLAQAPYWQPVPVSLDTWDRPANSALRTGSGRVILPGGWEGFVDFPRLSFDLAANMRATGVLWVAGDAAPGATVPIGLPGYPLLGRAVFRTTYSQSGPRRAQLQA